MNDTKTPPPAPPWGSRLVISIGVVECVVALIALSQSVFSSSTGLAVLFAALAIMTILVSWVFILRAQTPHELARAGRTGLIVTVVMYGAGLAILWYVPESERRPLAWVSATLIILLSIVASSIAIRRSRFETPRYPSPLALGLQTALIAVGGSVLGLAAAGVGSALIEFSQGREATGVVLLLQALMLCTVGFSLLLARRALVCQFLLGNGLAQAGFGAAAVSARSVEFGALLIGLAVCSCLLAWSLWTERRSWTALGLIVGAAFAAGLTLTSLTSIAKPAFALGFAVLGVTMLGAGVALLAAHHDAFTSLRSHHFGIIAPWQFALQGLVALSLAFGLFAALLDVLIPLRVGDRWAVTGVFLAALSVLGSSVLGAWLQPRRWRERLAAPL